MPELWDEELLAIWCTFTKKEQIFLTEYFKDFNATRAATEAGYSEKTASVIGHENLRKPKFLKFIKKIYEKRIGNPELDLLRIISLLKNIAFAKVSDYVQVKNGRITIIDTDQLSEEQAAAVQSYSETVTQHGGSTTFKLHDKIEAAKLLAKLLRPLNDNKDDSTQAKSESGTVEEKLRPEEYMKILQDRLNRQRKNGEL